MGFFVKSEKLCIFAVEIALNKEQYKRHINSITIIRVQNQKRRKLMVLYRIIVHEEVDENHAVPCISMLIPFRCRLLEVQTGFFLRSP